MFFISRSAYEFSGKKKKERKKSIWLTDLAIIGPIVNKYGPEMMN